MNKPAPASDQKHSESASVKGHVFKKGHVFNQFFSRFAHMAARAAGSPTAFLLATAFIVIWALTGPIFGYSDTWQLVINTATTIITFLMVFLIQNTQNRDSLALQIKVSELIIAMKGAENSMAAVDDLSEEKLEQLHKDLCARAEATGNALSFRRGKNKKAS